MSESTARIWEEVQGGDGNLRSTWLSNAIEVCRACCEEKPNHKEDCPIAALEARLSKMENLRVEVENVIGMAHSFANFPSWLEQLEEALAGKKEA